MKTNYKVIAKAPATCGEFIQGIYNKVPCLVSCPIKIFAQTEVQAGSGKSNLKPKAKEAVKKLLKEKEIDAEILESLNITTSSDIPIGIGMASSTSDMLSALAGVSEFLDLKTTPEELSKICIEIEPSDNTMFKSLSLYNHYTGDLLREYNTYLTAPITVVEFNDPVDTIDFGYETEFKKSEEAFTKVVEKFESGLKKKDLKTLAEATTESARINQTALFKPYLEAMITLSLDSGGLGVLIGHSGSVFGVIEGENFDFLKFREGLKKASGGLAYTKIYETELIPGGVQIERIQSKDN